MPIYQYRERTSGRLVELWKPVARRDEVGPELERVTVPARVGVCGSLAPVEPNTAAHSVPRAFRQYELDHPEKGTKQIEREVGFSREHIRRVWNF